MADTPVMIPSDLAAELDALAEPAGRSRSELVAEAVARYVLEERLAIDRVVAARLAELTAGEAFGTVPGAMAPSAGLRELDAVLEVQE